MWKKNGERARREVGYLRVQYSKIQCLLNDEVNDEVNGKVELRNNLYDYL